MSESVHLGAPSYLATMIGSKPAGRSLLASLHGYTGAAATPENAVAAMERANTGTTKQVAQRAAEPQVQHDLAVFTRALREAKTPARLLANPTVLKVLLTANGLGDQLGDPALARKALLADPSKPNSAVNQLSDPRWLGMNKACAFATQGLAALKNPAAIAATANGYAEVLWRSKLDQTTPGLANALDFQQRASTITTVDQVLGDPTIRTVVITALGLREQTPVATRSASGEAISSRIDLTKFQDPAFVSEFTQSYLIAAQRAAQGAGMRAGMRADMPTSGRPEGTLSSPSLSTAAEPSPGLIV